MSNIPPASQYGNPPTEPEPHVMRSTGRVTAMIARFIGYVVYVYILFVEVILAIGFFLLLFGANPSSDAMERSFMISSYHIWCSLTYPNEALSHRATGRVLTSPCESPGAAAPRGVVPRRW